MLEVGIKAPDFELPDQNGKIHRLSDYTGKKVILYFYPRDNTPGCTKNHGETSLLITLQQIFGLLFQKAKDILFVI